MSITMELGKIGQCRKGFVRIKILSAFPSGRAKIQALVDCEPDRIRETLEYAGWKFCDEDSYGHDDKSIGYRRCLMDGMEMGHTIVTGASSI